MKKFFLDVTFATLCAALLAACGGDSGSSADSLDESSSSSEMDGAESSASAEPESSGSEGVKGSSASVPGGSSDASVYDADKNTLKDLRDGQTYKTTTIDIPSENYSEVWMAQNLNYAYTGVPFDNGYYTSDSTSWCYDNVPANCAKYGRLYTWAAAMDSVGEWSTNGKGCGYGKECSAMSPVRGVCPKGWHLPSQSEWEALFTSVGGSSTAGSKLKSATGWSSSGNGTDTFGFSALPAGYRDFNGYYTNEGNDAYFWSSTELGSYGYGAYYMNLDYLDDGVYLNDYNKYNGFSVRCLKD